MKLKTSLAFWSINLAINCTGCETQQQQKRLQTRKVFFFFKKNKQQNAKMVGLFCIFLIHYIAAVLMEASEMSQLT